MQLVILLIVMSVLGAFTIKCMKNEDSIMELEDKIIADFHDFIRSNKKSKNAQTPRVICQNNISGNRAA